MDKFETLEDYQNSLKKFNERTRKSYEDFIQEYGDESQKLQLRCTPFTEKKGRYGVASLDFGFQIWQLRQAEVDELKSRIEGLESWIEGQIENLKCASKSWVYTEREKNIMLSQADDLKKALRGEHE